jgi:hypothetical protein
MTSLEEDEIEITVEDKTFFEIRSHKDKIKGFKNLEDMDLHHKLKKKFHANSWNNVPISVKDVIYEVIES